MRIKDLPETQTTNGLTDYLIVDRGTTPSTYKIKIGNLLTTLSGGAIDNSPIGASVPSTGAFTTLSTTGQSSLAANVGIGTTTPASALDVSSATGIISRRAASIDQYLTLYADANGPTLKFTGGTSPTKNGLIVADLNTVSLILSTLGAYPIIFSTQGTERLRIDAAGILGVGVVPSAWTIVKAIQVGRDLAIYADVASSDGGITSNASYLSGTGWTYRITGTATQYQASVTGGHIWKIAPSGTAGTAITFTQAMTLDTNSNLNNNIVNSLPVTVVDGAGAGMTTNISTARSTGTASFGVYVADGTNNRRSAFFTDNTNNVWGLSHNYSTSGIPFVIRIGAGTEILRMQAGQALTLQGGTITAGTGIAFPAAQLASADVNTLDDYREGTATLTATGMTTSPTGTATFVKVGNCITMEVPAISGTSNATTFTLTGIPAAFRPATTRTCAVRVSDNGGAYALGQANVDSTGVITLFKDIGGTAFTAAGTKQTNVTMISYIV